MNRHGNTAAAILAVLVILICVNVFGFKYYERWDWTESSFYSLSDRTEQILRSLDEKVRIVSFLVDYGQAGSDALPEISALIDVFEAENPGQLSATQIDPLRDPMRAETLLQEFGIDPRRGDPTDVVVVESGSRRRMVALDEMVQLDQGPGMGAAPRARSLTAEGALAAAIVAVTREEKPLLRFATGHGERTRDAQHEAGISRLAEALEQDDLEISTWDALAAKSVPEHTGLIVIAGPTQPWLEAERGALADYLGAGGRVLLLADPVALRGSDGVIAPIGLEDLLGDWGLSLDPDVVIDPARTPAFMSPETFVGQQVGDHPITERLAGEAVLVAVARSISLSPEQAGIRTSVLLESSADSWGETRLGAQASTIEKGDDDLFGPLAIAVAAEQKNAEGTPPGRLVIVGDADLASNLRIDDTTNRAFLLNSVAWLVGEERSLGMPPKDRQLSRLFLTSQQTFALGFGAVAGIPAFAIGMGLLTWWRRRSR